MSGRSESDLARLKIALAELYYLRSGIEIRTFRNALAAQYSSTAKIVGERGIQRAYSRLTSHISATDRRLGDVGDERKAINELKKFLAG